MKPILVAGSGIVTLALIAYSAGIIAEHRKKALTWRVLIFLGFGLLFDISGTICMIIGSTNSPFTFHGIIGYTALLGMLVDNMLLWYHKSKNEINTPITKFVHIYSQIAYLWWIAVYVSGLIRSMHL